MRERLCGGKPIQTAIRWTRIVKRAGCSLWSMRFKTTPVSAGGAKRVHRDGAIRWRNANSTAALLGFLPMQSLQNPPMRRLTSGAVSAASTHPAVRAMRIVQVPGIGGTMPCCLVREPCGRT